jgi:hypothetical protein
MVASVTRNGMRRSTRTSSAPGSLRQTSRSSAVPGRLVPISLITSSTTSMRRPPIETITSPARRPADSAGLPGVTLETTAGSSGNRASAAATAGSGEPRSRSRSAPSICTPRNPRETVPCSMSCPTTFSTIDIGMASPIPANCPLPTVLPRPVAIAVFMPITSPRMSASGPPEFPGLIAASTWMKLSYSTSSRPALRPIPETMPLDTLKRKSKGDPNANTRSPCEGRSAERRAGSSPFASTRSTATSVRGSSPTSVAPCSDPSWSCTSSSSAESTTCALVTTWPSASQTQPDPDCVKARAPRRPLAFPATLTCTTAGSTARATSRAARE